MIRAILNTGSTTGQGKLQKRGAKFGEEYKREVAVCYLNPEDFRRLWWEHGKSLKRVKVRSEFGEVVVYAKPCPELKRGHAFMPRGPWSNVVVAPETFETGSPFYKGMLVEIEATEEEVKSCKELLEELRGEV